VNSPAHSAEAQANGTMHQRSEGGLDFIPMWHKKGQRMALPHFKQGRLKDALLSNAKSATVNCVRQRACARRGIGSRVRFRF
jgi:hypothetical protein